ncbi:hypothetical protein [Rhodococcus erythropolis]|uniref:Uncharacterized protein n=1 Tax=Rhodococcus erythropolis TaxID=1833 RepID=A0A8I1A1F0_RHOER|nr:hypothetical protein [Rhodococcus erythropolis]MBH5146353.1 hypothetical protein [Rhodococcus erythropolis]
MNMAGPDAAASHIEYTYGPRKWSRPRWPFYILAASALAIAVTSVAVFVLCAQPWGYLAAIIYSSATLTVPVLLFLAVAVGVDEHQNYKRRRMQS